ncbi:MAG: hypothetical protein MJY84_06640 [Bacteroidales bacterium]|nr:hypothetical protein [Bacteroidales bacterium]
MEIRENSGRYLSPKVKIINVSMTRVILEGSYTNSIEKSGEEDEISW